MADKKILIVDDELDIIETLQFALEQEGYTCCTALDGVDGLAKARTENPDLIFLDIKLPKMNGYKVARLLKLDEKYRHIPIIILTAKTHDADRIKAIETGADEYVTKPFDISHVLELVKRYLV
ncbi:MAG: response regulator [Desulfobacterota bacterium]|nr:response regulator [Thermodesulfobacteriota bacterium]